MSNWVTLQNGVHIDLDDPNNPVTGSGSYESYLCGGSKGESKVYNQLRKLAAFVLFAFLLQYTTIIAFELFLFI